MKDYAKQASFQAAYQLQKGRTQAQVLQYQKWQIVETAKSFESLIFSKITCKYLAFHFLLLKKKKSTQLEKSSPIETLSILKVDKNTDDELIHACYISHNPHLKLELSAASSTAVQVGTDNSWTSWKKSQPC